MWNFKTKNFEKEISLFLIVSLILMLFSGCKKTSISVGDIIVVGSYKEENVEWIVLSIEEDKMLVVSKYVLDSYLFDTKGTTNWNKSKLHDWINDDFYNEAFSDEDKARIVATDFGDGYTDYLSLLSAEETNTLFESNEDRQGIPTAYVITSSMIPYSHDGHCHYWLRDVSADGKNAYLMGWQGVVEDQTQALSSWYGIRPIMWIKLE